MIREIFGFAVELPLVLQIVIGLGLLPFVIAILLGDRMEEGD